MMGLEGGRVWEVGVGKLDSEDAGTDVRGPKSGGAYGVWNGEGL